jgi:hypothetical protein
MKTQETQIPFCGFYHSIYDQMIDGEIEISADYYSEIWSDDQGVPNSTVLLQSIHEAMYSHIDVSDAHKAISEGHVKEWCEKFEDATGIALKPSKIEMTSPKYYNFATDRVFARVSEGAIKACYDLFTEGKGRPHSPFHILNTLIEKSFTSCDGFSSHYSNQLEDWLVKPLNEWDHNEVMTLLTATLLYCDVDLDDFNRDVEMSVLDWATGNGIIDVVDWDKVQGEIKVEEVA